MVEKGENEMKLTQIPLVEYSSLVHHIVLLSLLSQVFSTMPERVYIVLFSHCYLLLSLNYYIIVAFVFLSLALLSNVIRRLYV